MILSDGLRGVLILCPSKLYELGRQVLRWLNQITNNNLDEVTTEKMNAHLLLVIL